MTITGKYEKDQNFTRVYSDNTIYEIARNSGEWATLKVGEPEHTSGKVLTLELYKEMESACEKSGTFELREEGEE